MAYFCRYCDERGVYSPPGETWLHVKGCPFDNSVCKNCNGIGFTSDHGIRETCACKQGSTADLSPTAPTVTNEAGGKQSSLPYRCDLLPAKAVLEVSAVLCKGVEKYEPNNWRLISTQEHVNHAMTHILAFLAGDTQDKHLQHAACRMLMAVEMEIEKK